MGEGSWGAVRARRINARVLVRTVLKARVKGCPSYWGMSMSRIPCKAAITCLIENNWLSPSRFSSPSSRLRNEPVFGTTANRFYSGHSVRSASKASLTDRNTDPDSASHRGERIRRS